MKLASDRPALCVSAFTVVFARSRAVRFIDLKLRVIDWLSSVWDAMIILTDLNRLRSSEFVQPVPNSSLCCRNSVLDISRLLADCKHILTELFLTAWMLWRVGHWHEKAETSCKIQTGAVSKDMYRSGLEVTVLRCAVVDKIENTESHIDGWVLFLVSNLVFNFVVHFHCAQLLALRVPFLLNRCCNLHIGLAWKYNTTERYSSCFFLTC